MADSPSPLQTPTHGELVELEASAQAAVRLMRPEEGVRLKAFVVPKDGAGTEQEPHLQLWAWIDRELAPPERPKALRFGPALPMTPEGKAADWSLQG